MGKLEGKVVVVTGTSRGLGKAIVEVAADEGSLVTGASRSGGFDITREEDVRRLFDQVIQKHRRVDVLINNAGVLTPRKSLAEVSLGEWNDSLAGNLTGAFLCTREALRHMIPAGDGLILNVSSGVANRPSPTWGPYAVAKWGLEGLARLVAEEVGGEGIRVVSVNPGRTRTPMRAAAYPDEDPLTVKTPEETARFFVSVAAGEVPFESGDLLQYQESS